MTIKLFFASISYFITIFVNKVLFRFYSKALRKYLVPGDFLLLFSCAHVIINHFFFSKMSLYMGHWLWRTSKFPNQGWSKTQYWHLINYIFKKEILICYHLRANEEITTFQNWLICVKNISFFMLNSSV